MADDPFIMKNINRERRHMWMTNLAHENQPVNLRATIAGTKQFDAKGSMTSLQFYENDNPADNLAFGLTLHEAAHAETNIEAVGATLSIITQSWSGVRVVMDKACSFAGIRMISVHLPSEAEAYCINPAEILLYSTNEMMIYNTYFMMLPFMNVSNNNYEESFNRWITELKAIVGVPNDTDIRPVLTLERAANVRQVLGANIKLCRTLIKCFIDEKQRGGRWERCAEYVLDIISWNVMSAYRSVYESLMLTNSPIFFNRMISEEVIALAELLDAMDRTQYPHFFPYFGTLDDVSKLERSRFPILHSVAMIVKQHTRAPSENYFALPVTNDQIPLVLELVKEHMMTTGMWQEEVPMEETTYRRPAHHDAGGNANERYPIVNCKKEKGVRMLR